nr:Putative ribonuclease H protein At1g65750 family [Cajanus cajan]
MLPAKSPLFKQIWKWHGPERVRVFLWRVAHESLLTNFCRVKRGMSSDSTCGECRQAMETTLHVLRDCPYAQEVWNKTCRGLALMQAFRGNLENWLLKNLFRSQHLRPDWSFRFGITLDSLWHRRNRAVFQNLVISSDQLVAEIQARIAPTLSRDFNQDLGSGSLYRNTEWTYPSTGTLKLNCDGAVARDGEASCGGVVRNSNGEFVVAFYGRLGRCSILEAELKAILQGTRIVLERNVGQVILVESDSSEAIKILNEGCSRVHPCCHIVREIKDLSTQLSRVS